MKPEDKIYVNYLPVGVQPLDFEAGFPIDAKPATNEKTDEPLSWDDVESVNKPESNATRKQIFAQNTAPTEDFKEGDLWFETDDNNEIHRANSSLQWVSLRDGTIATAAGTANWSEIVDDDSNKPDNNADVTATNNNWSEVNDDDSNKPANNATVGATFGSDIAGGGASNTQCGDDGYTTLYRYHIFGNGEDGNLTTSGDVNLTDDTYYDDLTIATGHTIYTKGYRLFVKGTLTFQGTGKIDASGGNGGNGEDGGGNGSANSGGAGGTAAHSAGTLPASVAAGAGASGKSNGGAQTAAGNGVDTDKGVNNNDASDSGAGGSGGGSGIDGDPMATGTSGNNTGSITNPLKIFGDVQYFRDWADDNSRLDITPSPGGGGGGGQGGSSGYGTGGAGGGAGATGGVVFVCAKKIATVNGNNYITADSGNGGDGGDGFTYSQTAKGAGGGGGGAGGNGGVAIVVYQSKTGTGTISVAAGSGGALGSGGANSGSGADGDDGTAGAAGSAGSSITIQI